MTGRIYSVMIVEDEPPIVDMIRILIEGSGGRFRVAATAANGRDALPVFEKVKPDVLFCDIRMPHRSGLELISDIRKVSPDTICVILSGYNEFDFARNAMRLQVTEYLLKPLSASELYPLLEKLQILLDRRYEQAEAEYLRCIVTHGRIVRELGLSYKAYFALLISFSGQPHFSITDLTSQSSEQPGILTNTSSDACRIRTYSGASGSEIIAVAVLSRCNESVIRETADSIMRLLKKEQTPVSIVCGKLVHDPHELGPSVKSMALLLDRNRVFAESYIYSETDKAAKAALSDQLSILIKKAAAQPSFRGFEEIFTSIIEQLKSSKATQRTISLALHRLADALDALCPDVDVATEADLALDTPNSYIELKEKFLMCAKKSYSMRGGETVLFAKEQVDLIEEFIQNHYSMNINGKMLYDEFGYNEVYLTSVFKSMKGISPIKYLTKVRMQKAAELMRNNPDILVKTVAEMVGYPDPLHFSRVFKDTLGVSPSDFMKSRS
jgi:two-component system response regulator YesN